MGSTQIERSSIRTTVPRMLALLVLVTSMGIARATPLHYSFDFGTAGAGDFTIKADASAPLVDQNELASFNWHVAGIGAFDLADLSAFGFSSWSPLLGASANSNGWLALGFVLKTGALSDAGVACALCVSAAQLALPNTTAPGALVRTRIRATGSPCGSGLCVGQTPTLALVPAPVVVHDNAVPEPTALSLAGLALLSMAWRKRGAARA